MMTELNFRLWNLSKRYTVHFTTEGRGEGAMKSAFIHAAVFTFSLAMLGCVAGQQTGYYRHPVRASAVPVTVHDVVRMSRAGVADSLIISMVAVSGSPFNLGASEVIALADSGVSAPVINAMIHANPLQETADQASTVVAMPWYPYWGYPYYGYPYYAYDPFWYPWYYPAYSIRVGFDHGFRGGYGGRRGIVRRGR
jgi:hypothetical protein